MIRAKNEQMVKSLSERYEEQIRASGDKEADVEAFREQVLTVGITNKNELRDVASDNDEHLRKLARENNERLVMTMLF